MAEPNLAPRPAWAGLDLPLGLGGVTLAAAPDAPRFALAPYRGQAAAIEALLGGPLPEPGRLTAFPGGARLIWNGLGQYFHAGAVPDPRLADHAALCDQTDGWAGFTLAGAAARDVLARLVPLDLDPAAFPPGSVARSQLRHIACLLIAHDDAFEIHVMRSFTHAAVHDIETAMRAVAARREVR